MVARFKMWVSPGGVEPHPYEIRGTRYNVFPLMSSAHWVKAQPCALDETSRFEIRGYRQKVFPLGTSAHWVKRHACARFRATTWGRPYGIRGTWYNVFPLGTVAHWMKRHVSKCGFPRAPAASEHALFSSLFLKEKHRFFGGSSFIPQKQSFCGSPISHPISKSAAIGIIFFLLCHPRIGSRLSLVLWERGGAGHKVNLRGKAAK